MNICADMWCLLYIVLITFVLVLHYSVIQSFLTIMTLDSTVRDKEYCVSATATSQSLKVDECLLVDFVGVMNSFDHGEAHYEVYILKWMYSYYLDFLLICTYHSLRIPLDRYSYIPSMPWYLTN